MASKVQILGRSVPRAVIWLSAAALGFLAICWFGISFILSCNRGTMAPDFDYGILVGLPGLIPAFLAWVLAQKAQEVDFEEVEEDGPHSMEIDRTTSEPGAATPSRRPFVAALVLAVACLLEAALVTLLVLCQMSSQHVFRPEGFFFLATALAPAGFTAWLSWRIARAPDGPSPRYQGSNSLTLLILGELSAMTGLVGALVGTIGYLAVSWYSVSFNVGGVTFLLVPALVFGGIASWLLDLAAREEAAT